MSTSKQVSSAGRNESITWCTTIACPGRGRLEPVAAVGDGRPYETTCTPEMVPRVAASSEEDASWCGSLGGYAALRWTIAVG